MAVLSLPLRLRLFTFGRVLRRLSRVCDGVNSIEFALLAVPLFTFLLGVVEFASLCWTISDLQYAAEAAARCATVNCCGTGAAMCGGNTGNTGVQNYAVNQLLGMSLSTSALSNFSVTGQACGNQVSFEYTFNFLAGPLFPTGALTLVGKACNQA
jgi:Flp pilus assembly protein TadG